MTRRKGEITARMNERDFPPVVELVLPEGGLPFKRNGATSRGGNETDSLSSSAAPVFQPAGIERKARRQR
jgi:hypothetical protein